MRVPTLTGIIDRRILINYQVDKEALEAYLPKPFRPKLVKGKGVAGICLIRLKSVRPKGFPAFLGFSSENGAHRIAVEWEEAGQTKEGVYIPRRDTSSKLNAWLGGRLFPGVHHLAHFNVSETADRYEVAFTSEDDTALSIVAQSTDQWNGKSVFENQACASQFFEDGSVGYSPSRKCFDGLLLKVKNWEVSLLSVESVYSSFFEDESLFPKESVVFDNALLMKNIAHEWVGLPSKSLE